MAAFRAGFNGGRLAGDLRCRHSNIQAYRHLNVQQRGIASGRAQRGWWTGSWSSWSRSAWSGSRLLIAPPASAFARSRSWCRVAVSRTSCRGSALVSAKRSPSLGTLVGCFAIDRGRSTCAPGVTRAQGCQGQDIRDHDGSPAKQRIRRARGFPSSPIGSTGRPARIGSTERSA